MERLWSMPRSALGALALLLMLNVLAWAIIAYSGSNHANDAQTWSHEKTRLLGELDQRQSTIAALEGQLDEQKKAGEDLESIRLQLASEAQNAAAQSVALAEQLSGYRERINLARSELSGKTATLAAREREIAKAADQLTLLSDASDLETSIEQHRVQAEAELQDYRQRINLARSELSGITATIAIRERKLAGIAEELSFVDEAVDLEAAIAAERQAMDARRAQAMDELQDYRERINLARSELSGKTATIAVRQRKLAEIAEELSFVNEAVDLEAAIAAERQAIDERRNKATAELKNYRHRINLARSELSGKTAMLAARERELAGADQQLGEMNNAISAADREIQRRDQALAERAEADSELAAVQEKLAAARNEQATTLAILGTLANKIGRQRDRADQNQQTLMTLRSGIQTTEGRLSEREAELGSAEQRLSALRKEIGITENELATLQKDSETTASSLALRKQELSKLETNLSDLRQQQTETQTLVASLAQERDAEEAARGDLEGVSKELANVSASLETRKKDLAETQASFRAADIALKQTEKTLSQKRKEAKELNQEIKKGEDRLIELDQSTSAIETRAEKAKQRLTTDGHQIAEGQKKIAALRREEEKARVMITGLKARLAEQRQMETDIDRLHAAAEQAKTDLDEQRRLLDEQKAQGAKVETRVMQLMDERSTLERQVKALSSDLSVKEALAQTLDDVETRLAEKEGELSGLTNRQAGMLGLLGSLDAKIEKQRDLAQDYSITEKQLASLQSNLSDTTTSLKQRESELESVETRFETLIDRIAHAETKLAKLETERSSEEAALAARRSDISESESELQTLTEQLEAKRAAVADAEARFRKIQAKVGDTGSAEEELATVTSSLDAARADLLAKQENIEQAEGHLAALEADIKTVNETEAATARRLAELDSKIDTARQAVDGLEDKKGTLTTEVEALQRALQERKADLATTEQALTSADDAKAKAATELEQLRTELEGSRSALELARQGNNDVANEAEALASSVSDLTQKAREAEEHRDAASVELEAVQLEVEKAKVDLAARESALLETRAELAELQRQNEQLLGDISTNTTPSGVDPLLAVQPVQTEHGLRIAHLLFNHGSAELSPGAERKIREAATWIKQNQAQKVRLIGYADATGSREANVRLSEARADQTAALLGRLGIVRDIIEIEAVGEDVLIEATGNRVSEPLNRSVGIFVDR
ncbi:MAG: OmpA family protein [Pseudomonadota bacterium]